jgi:hypothetical protein
MIEGLTKGSLAYGANAHVTATRGKVEVRFPDWRSWCCGALALLRTWLAPLSASARHVGEEYCGQDERMGSAGAAPKDDGLRRPHLADPVRFLDRWENFEDLLRQSVPDHGGSN